MLWLEGYYTEEDDDDADIDFSKMAGYMGT